MHILHYKQSIAIFGDIHISSSTIENADQPITEASYSSWWHTCYQPRMGQTSAEATQHVAVDLYTMYS